MSQSLFPDRLVEEVADLVHRYGYEPVATEVAMHAPPVPSAPARHTDPATSHAAGPRSGDVRRFSARSRQAKLLNLFLGKQWTAQRCAIAVVGIDAPISALEGCRRRISDLVAAGFIADSGQREKNSGSHDDSILWQITLSGMQAIKNLDRTGWSRP